MIAETQRASRRLVLPLPRGGFGFLIEPCGHGAFQGPCDLEGAFGLVAEVAGLAEAEVGLGEVGDPFVLADEEDDVGAGLDVADVALAGGGGFAGGVLRLPVEEV